MGRPQVAKAFARMFHLVIYCNPTAVSNQSHAELLSPIPLTVETRVNTANWWQALSGFEGGLERLRQSFPFVGLLPSDMTRLEPGPDGHDPGHNFCSVILR